MIAMDSSNMHMAALVGTKVISIWGGTDPLSGFGAWMQPDNFSISIPVDELDLPSLYNLWKRRMQKRRFCMHELADT